MNKKKLLKNNIFKSAFVNRKDDFQFLERNINYFYYCMFFLHGPSKSGKKTLVKKFFKNAIKKYKCEIKYLDISKNEFTSPEDFRLNLFKIKKRDSIKYKHQKKLKYNKFYISKDYFNTICKYQHLTFQPIIYELKTLFNKKINPVVIINLPDLSNGYKNYNQKNYIYNLLNLFVAMTKESHLCYVLILSPNTKTISRVFFDARLSKTSCFHEVGYLEKEDVEHWLGNLDKYNNVIDYKLTKEEIQKIWSFFGGNPYHINSFLIERFNEDTDTVCEKLKKKMSLEIKEHIFKSDFVVKKEILSKLLYSKNNFDIYNMSSKEYEILKELIDKNIIYSKFQFNSYSIQNRLTEIVLQELLI